MRPSSPFRVILTALAVFLLNGCASLEPHLWPPAAGEKTYAVYVSLDTWHGMIALPVGPGPSRVAAATDPERLPPSPARSNVQPHFEYEEWGYAERRWYVEHDQGVIGALRALFWPTAGVVEIARYEQLWASRTPQPPADLFVFHLNQSGLLRLQNHLQATLAGHDPVAAVGGSVFYPSRHSYHLFHHCHHYIAQALGAAGLPVSPLWAMGRTLLAGQLDRAKRLAEDFTAHASADSR